MIISKLNFSLEKTEIKLYYKIHKIFNIKIIVYVTSWQPLKTFVYNCPRILNLAPEPATITSTISACLLPCVQLYNEAILSFDCRNVRKIRKDEREMRLNANIYKENRFTTHNKLSVLIVKVKLINIFGFLPSDVYLKPSKNICLVKITEHFLLLNEQFAFVKEGYAGLTLLSYAMLCVVLLE